MGVTEDGGRAGRVGGARGGGGASGDGGASGGGGGEAEGGERSCGEVKEFEQIAGCRALDAFPPTPS